MKKNKMMRLASLLLVCVLLTTSVIGGTFAKYVTTDSANDTARVAKWGVVASVSGDLFGATYLAAEGDTITSYSKNPANGETVSSADEAKVVAPGTENKTGLTLSVSGTPEVSTKVTLDAAQNDAGVVYANSDIYLAKGSYGVMVPYTGVKTVQNCENYFTTLDGSTYAKATGTDLDKAWYELHDAVTFDDNDNDYHPLVWYVNDAPVADINAVESVLEDTFNDKTFKPNDNNALSATVGWEWAFGDAWADQANTNDEIEVRPEDKKDTILGNMMVGADAKVVAASGNNYIAVEYATVEADLDDQKACANEIVVAKVGDDIVACLTAAFNARLTVEQVD